MSGAGDDDLVAVQVDPQREQRGQQVAEPEQVAHLLADVLETPTDEARLAEVRAKVAVLCKRFPVYGD